MTDMNEIDKMLDRKMLNRQRSGFWYVSGASEDSKGRMKQFLLGPFPDADVANDVIERKRLVGKATAIQVNTSDLSRAGQIIKAMRLQGNASMSDIFSRVQHKNVGGRDSI
jgi:hypothetical protein